MSLVTQIASLAARVAAEIKLLRTEIPPDLPTYTAGSPTPPPLTYDVVGDAYFFDAAKTPCLVTDPATGAVRWELGLNVEYVGTTYDILVAGMTVGLGGGRTRPTWPWAQARYSRTLRGSASPLWARMRSTPTRRGTTTSLRASQPWL